MAAELSGAHFSQKPAPCAPSAPVKARPALGDRRIKPAPILPHSAPSAPSAPDPGRLGVIRITTLGGGGRGGNEGRAGKVVGLVEHGLVSCGVRLDRNREPMCYTLSRNVRSCQGRVSSRVMQNEAEECR